MPDIGIILKDGTIYENGECGYSDRKLWCWLKDTTMNQAFADFSDSRKIEEIHYVHGKHDTVYFGFTDLDVIKKREYNIGEFGIDIRLSGENLSMEEREIDENIQEENNNEQDGEEV